MPQFPDSVSAYNHPPPPVPNSLLREVKIINDDIHHGLFLLIFPYDRHPACLHSLNVFNVLYIFVSVADL